MKLPEQIQFQGSAESKPFSPVIQASPTKLIEENTNRLLAGQARNFEMEDANLRGVAQVERNNQRLLYSQLQNFSETAAKFTADWAKRDQENKEIGEMYSALLEGTDVTVERQREAAAEQQAITEGDRQGEQVSRIANDMEERTGDVTVGEFAREQLGGLARGVQGERAMLLRAQTSYGSWLAAFLESDGFITLGGRRMSIREAANSGDSRLVSAVIAAGRGEFIRENGLQHATKENFVRMLGNTIISTEGAIAGAAVREGIKAAREERIKDLEGLGYNLAQTTDSVGAQEAFNQLSAQFFRSSTGMSRGSANEAAIKALISGWEDAGNVDALQALLDVQQVPGQKGTELRTRYGNLINDAVVRAQGRRDDIDGRQVKDLEAGMYQALAGAQTQQQRDQIIEQTATQMEAAGLYQQARQLRQQRDELSVAGANELNAARLEEGLRTGSVTTKDVENARLRGDITSQQAEGLLRNSGGGFASGEEQLKDPTLKGTLDSYGDSFDSYFLGRTGLRRSEFGRLLPGQKSLITTEQAEIITQQARNDLRQLAAQVLTTYADQPANVKQQKLHEAFKEWMREQVKTPGGKYYVAPKVKNANGVEGWDKENQRQLQQLATNPANLANPRLGSNSTWAPRDWSGKVTGTTVPDSVRNNFRRLRGDKLFDKDTVEILIHSYEKEGRFQQGLMSVAQRLGMSPLALLQQQASAYGLGAVQSSSLSLESSSTGAPTSGVQGAHILMGMGVPAKGAAWLSGNIQQESQWNGQRQPWDDGGALSGGLVSWRAGRLQNAERAVGGDISRASNQQQLRYMLQEMREKYPSAYRIFMNPHATDRQLIAASRAYWGYGEEGNRFGYAQSIESNVRRRGRPQNQMAGDARQRTVTIGRNLINSGYKIWEHPNFDLNRGYVPSGGRVGRHADRSFHYEGQALDIPLSHNSVARLDALYRHLNANRGRYGISELLWRVPGHHTHLHVAFN